MKKKNKYLSIILVHDERKGPISLKVRYLYIKIFLIIFIFLGSVIIFAGKAYWKMTEVFLDYNYLKEKNLKLEDDNIQINKIIKEFNDLKRNDERIKELLGVTIPIPDRNTERGIQIDTRVKSENADISNTDRNYLNDIPYDIPSNYTADLTNNYSYIPTYLPLKGYVTKRYLTGKDNGNTIHYGIDIVAKLKSVIRASGSGVIIFANWTYEYGNTIIIDHLNGYLSYYKHNHRLLKQQGDFVTQGMAIALLGNSGQSSAPHLHFEIWKNGKPLNPEKLILNLK